MNMLRYASKKASDRTVLIIITLYLSGVFTLTYLALLFWVWKEMKIIGMIIDFLGSWALFAYMFYYDEKRARAIEGERNEA